MKEYSHWLLYYQGQNRKYKKQTGYLQYEFPQQFLYFCIMILYYPAVILKKYFNRIGDFKKKLVKEGD